MSIIFENKYGYYISHKKYIDKLYEDISEGQYSLNDKLFDIVHPYKKRRAINKSNDKINRSYQAIKLKFAEFMKVLKGDHEFIPNPTVGRNQDALDTAEFVYRDTEKALVQNSHGSNFGLAKLQKINYSHYFFPENSEFFCKDILDISTYLNNRQFDFILLDPPWWNKYIRRKRKKSNDGYKMLYNTDLKNIPIETLLVEDGLVAVWCTNSPQNLEELLNKVFPKWGIQLVAKWYWIKVTKSGDPVCDFSDPPAKQPYEQIILGTRKVSLPLPENDKLVVSIPSAIHSHKPPLTELLKPYLPENPSCLEIFARYLLPNFTSYGNEVLRLQHESLFTKIKI